MLYVVNDMRELTLYEKNEAKTNTSLLNLFRGYFKVEFSVKAFS